MAPVGIDHPAVTANYETQQYNETKHKKDQSLATFG
jgi:hypothetical protein